MANWIDNLVAFISPKRGAEREAWRQQLEEMRNYDAGQFDRLNAGWITYNQSAEQTDRSYRDTVRGRARDLERNSDMANSVIGAYKRNVVGMGWTLQARTDNEELNTQIEELWREWCKKRNCDVAETQSFPQMLRMAVERKKVDGGILFRKCYMSGGIVPFRLQPLEVDELDISAMNPHNKNDQICDGIEFNEYGKPVGYWIKQYSLNGFTDLQPEYVPAKNMIFIYSKRRPSQVREMSDLAPVLTRIRDANEFMTAVSVKERVAACLSVFIKREIPATTGIGRGAGTIPAGKHFDYDGKMLTPGMIKELNAGDEIQVVNPAGQATDAASFMKLFQRLIGAGQGLSYEATSRDMSQSNYSSARQGIIEDEQTYIEDRELFEEFQDEVYESFVISAVLSNQIEITDFWTNKKKYLAHEWIMAPKDWIDPLKEVEAMETAVKTGQKTFKQAAAENGHDWKEQVNDMVEVLEYGKEKGIDLGGILYGKSNDPEPEPEDEGT